jgi:NADPH:quinone reductase-like Zn-dependent oxidoreductase
MKYKSLIVARFGGLEVFQIIKNDLRAPAAGEARIRILATPVCRPDITVRQSVSLYHGTPLGQKLPFTPGYAVTGKVDAVDPGVQEVCVGDRVGALTITGWHMESGEVVENVVLQVSE